MNKKSTSSIFEKNSFQKRLSKITISNITDECGVNRQTFYYHFKDVYNLLEWIYKNEVIDEIDNKDEEWQQRFLYIFKYVLKNKEFVKNTYNSISREYLLRLFICRQNKLLIDFIDKE
ncbi:MAG: TetR/AcrR family transcriptional regulator C-terminal domain-containing protein [Bacilli bacterium]